MRFQREKGIVVTVVVLRFCEEADCYSFKNAARTLEDVYFNEKPIFCKGAIMCR